MGISHRVDLVTGSSLQKQEFLLQAEQDFRDNQSGILTNPGGDLIGDLFFF
jgi:hypothetical protein